jgi:cell division protein FtsW
MASKTQTHFLSKPVNHLYMLLISASALTFLGLIMVFSASSIQSIDSKGTALAVVLRQLLFVAISIPLAGYLSKLPIARWEVAGRLGLVISIALLGVLVIPGVGKTVNGNTNWINLKIIDVQPSEFAKLFMILWASFLLARKEKSGRFNVNVFMLMGPGFLLIMALVMYGHDLGTASVLAAILAGLLFVSGIRLRLFGAITALGGVLLAAFIVTSGYRAARFLVFINPFAPADYKYAGWQPAHSLLGLASGGLFGVGLGGSRQKWGNLAEAHTDFIFSVIGEELGFIGTLFVLVLMTTLIYSIFRISLRAQEPMVRFACAGIGCWITVQAFLNIGSATSVLPVVGVTLPLVSYGGSALVATICAIGFVAGSALRDPEVRREIVKKRTK